MEENKICFGLKIVGKGCGVLIGNDNCDGLNTKCPFYKTRKKATEESDRAIDICRAKGLCTNCQYRQSDTKSLVISCKKSTEEHHG